VENTIDLFVMLLVTQEGAARAKLLVKTQEGAALRKKQRKRTEKEHEGEAKTAV
jgi:hypothetical protein